MIKREELTNPNSCMSRAREDEMTFVLLERDAAAPAAIRIWVRERIRLGKNKPRDPQITEALRTADLIAESHRRQPLEANWVWDPVRGDIPFKRPRITPRNIRLQQKLARPCTLIHWAGKPCTRGRSKTDERKETCASGAVITSSGLASHVENVNCLQCRRNFFSWWRSESRREQSRKLWAGIRRKRKAERRRRRRVA